ncbi:D-2-hydroxyacid dehydrogenase [Pseudomonas sp. DY-1]|jgi:phosphoglycerate dehydrogenase-like enzyme|uniref:D-2-hydroxyacid dehydrogenase n=1 Tax=unclassified Pseudomonas TaxID=196821 RepID=UPI000EA8891C|nr:D-2-hydroxyacid dehydrogenase [Pseudomonas sp. DY-1]AYF87610.1 D-2-hydroxyacid dehydrogenase [Pseudomonas sp. DY-1]
MKILIAESEFALYADLLRTESGLQLHGGSEVERLLYAARECTVWLGEPDLMAELLRKGCKPEWMQSTWAGITPLLATDLPTDYRLTRAVGIFGQVMAEYVLTYLLAHQRQLFSRVAAQSEKRWDNRLPRSLEGKRVLIVGAGDIGQSVAGFLEPFGIELHGIAREPRQFEPFERVSGMEALAEQVAWADCVVNLLPDTPATRDIYDARIFACMQPTALFINAGRGVAVVDHDLVAALEAGQLAGAVIDVCREEPLPAWHPFWGAPNLLVTGHSSAPTLPSAMARLFVENLSRYRSGATLRGQVNFERGY